MVAGGFELISYTTLLTPLTLLIILFDTDDKKSCSNVYQSAVIPSTEVTALRARTNS